MEFLRSGGKFFRSVGNIYRTKGSKEAARQGLVGISLDDGPNPDNILQVLDILKEYEAYATFFPIVANVHELMTEDRELFDQVYGRTFAEGHELGLHGAYDYKPTPWDRTVGRFGRKHLASAKQDLKDMTGFDPAFYRPHTVGGVRGIVSAWLLGLTTVSGRYRAFALPDDDVLYQIERNTKLLRPGDILVQHDGISISTQETRITEVLPAVLDIIRDRGLKPTKLSELIR